MYTNIVFTTSSGREFHSLIVRGKKEILQTYFFVLRITNLKGWFPRVFLSLVCFRWAATEKFVSSSGGFPSSVWLVARVSRLSFCSIPVTLAYRF